MTTPIECNLRNIHHSAVRINSICRLLNAKTYLEIGVRGGDTFFKINAEQKFAVDPYFAFDTKLYKDVKNIHFFPTTSDVFFEILSKSFKATKFDVIFLDGLHTYQQTLTDFKNSLKYSHDNTVWIIDDTVPTTFFSSVPDYDLANCLHELMGYKHRPWHGDVYKTLLYIHDNFLEFSYCTLLNKPQSIVWKTPEPQARKKIFPSDKELHNATYFDVLLNAAKFNPVSEHMYMDIIGKKVNLSYTDEVWKQFITKFHKSDFNDQMMYKN